MIRYTNLKRIIDINIKIISFFGIMWGEEEGIRLIFRYLKTFLFVGVFLATLTVSEAISVYQNATGIEEVSSALFLFLTHIVQILKYQCIFSHQARLRGLIKNITRKEFLPKSQKHETLLEEYISTSVFVTKLLLFACVATCVFWTVYPFTEGCVNLPLAGWYPWNTTKSPMYELTFLYQIVNVTVNGLIICSIDTFMSGLLMVVCSQFHILNDTLLNLRQFSENELGCSSKPNDQFLSPELQAVMDKKLYECVVHHWRILEFAGEFSLVFSSCMLGQMAISVIIICLTLFCLTLIPFGTMKFFSMILYLFCILMEIFLWCYFGNELTEQSKKLTTCAFSVDWKYCSLQFKRNLLFFMVRSQKELNMYAGGFFTLSLNMFCKIIKSAWSYFVVLVQVTNE